MKLLIPDPAPQLTNVAIKSSPEDFVVEEIPLYEPGGQGTHSYFQIEKQKLTTQSAVKSLARALQLPPKAAFKAGYVGLKDADAVTRQWVSMEHVKDSFGNLDQLNEKLAEQNSDEDGPKLKIIQQLQHSNKLKMGHLKGNRFKLLLRIQPENLEETKPILQARLETVLPALAFRGLPNRFGKQRFGRDQNNAELGKLLVQGNVGEFLRLQTGGRITEGTHSPGRLKKELRNIDRRLRNLIVNAFQSELFNHVLDARLAEFDTLREGDLAYLHRNGAVFSVDTEDELNEALPRCKEFEISATGPLFGPKMKRPTGKVDELESSILAATGVTPEDFGRPEAEKQKGARRPLRVPFIESPDAKEEESGFRLTFALPSGSYATTVTHEVLGT